MNFVKKTAVAIGALLASSVAASAADMDTPLSYWSGFYVGAQVGAGANVSDFLCEGDCDDILLDTSLNNILAGGYVGYNYQIDRFVVGVEGDLSAALAGMISIITYGLRLIPVTELNRIIMRAFAPASVIW